MDDGIEAIRWGNSSYIHDITGDIGDKLLWDPLALHHLAYLRRRMMINNSMDSIGLDRRVTIMASPVLASSTRRHADYYYYYYYYYYYDDDDDDDISAYNLNGEKRGWESSSS